jgi:hypothetical protein
VRFSLTKVTWGITSGKAWGVPAFVSSAIS